MAFPKNPKAWPPREWSTWYRVWDELAAWYSGDPARLLNFYTSSIFSSFQDTDLGRYWAHVEAEERREAVHLPLAGDIAQTSASLLFSEAPDIQYKDSDEAGKRIKAFLAENGFINTLLEGAEMAAALSGLFLKLDADPSLSGLPILTIRTPLNAMPEFASGRLKAVTFWREAKQDEAGAIWRLFEDRRIEGGKLNIRFKLYKGTSTHLGREVELESIEEVRTLNLEDRVLDMPVLGCVYIPNMRPNRLMPGSPLGESDFRTSIGLMDSLDFAWSSWMRDIELGIAQIFVDESLLDGEGKFSKFQRVFTKLNLDANKIGGEKYEPIKEIQFKLRVDGHMKTCDSLTRQIIGMAGYAPQTFGMVEFGRQTDSGTALRIRERKSLLTRGKKERYWIPALISLLIQMQLFDVATELSSRYELQQDINVVLQDSVVQDEKETSEVVRNLDQAKAVSTFMKVKMQHPGWTDTEIEEEVERINKEQGLGIQENPFEGTV